MEKKLTVLLKNLNLIFLNHLIQLLKVLLIELMHLMEDTVLNLRIRIPIDSEHPRNFITKIVNYEKICNCPNSMTVF